MIADVLYRRYPETWIHSGHLPIELATLIRQAALVLHDDVAARLPDRAQLFERPEKQLARELGGMALGRHAVPERNCMEMLGESYDLWNDSHGTPDSFFKLRLSLVELLFREAEAILKKYDGTPLKKGWSVISGKGTVSALGPASEALAEGIAELNRRFQSAGVPFEYHNGIIQRIDDGLTGKEIEAPFWALLKDATWTNVDVDMKEAVDSRDKQKADAAFHALKALESTIRILSDELGRTRGAERGAAEFIDNLVAKKPDRFIDVWESEALKALFRDLRNPFGHGAGAGQPIALSPQQTTFAIECCMSWIKSLVRRRP